MFLGWNELLLGLSIENGDPGVQCTNGFDIQAQSSSFNSALAQGKLFLNISKQQISY